MDCVLIGIDSFTMTVAAAGTSSVTSAVRRGKAVIASCIATLVVLRTILVPIKIVTSQFAIHITENHSLFAGI